MPLMSKSCERAAQIEEDVELCQPKDGRVHTPNGREQKQHGQCRACPNLGPNREGVVCVRVSAMARTAPYVQGIEKGIQKNVLCHICEKRRRVER
jgi:hypothetical protein